MGACRMHQHHVATRERTYAGLGAMQQNAAFEPKDFSVVVGVYRVLLTPAIPGATGSDDTLPRQPRPL